MSLNSRMKVLFEQDTFALVEDPIAATKDTQVDIHSWIRHKLCTDSRYAGEYYISLTDKELAKGQCVFCFKKIPDELMALWRLHNWDYPLRSCP